MGFAGDPVDKNPPANAGDTQLAVEENLVFRQRMGTRERRKGPFSTSRSNLKDTWSRCSHH